MMLLAAPTLLLLAVGARGWSVCAASMAAPTLHPPPPQFARRGALSSSSMLEQLPCRCSVVSPVASTALFEPPLTRLAHGSLLPPLARRRISHRDSLILAFVLEYLEESAHSNVSVHVSGGYVRDLLLGRESHDLDLAFCLRECAPHVTVDTVVEGMPAFALSRPELAVDTVEIVTALSDASKGKNMDAAQVRMTIRGTAALVDMMPTIGTEVYDSSDRIPQRDGRGTLGQDTLRRDLTVGAMLLHVTRPSKLPKQDSARVDELAKEIERRLAGEWRASRCPEFDKCVVAASNAARLEFRLLDFHGGVADLDAHVLRSPYPRHRSLSDVWREVIRTEDEEQMAARLGLDANAALTDEERQELLQTVWWIKVLRDDPLRIVRALRFSASLGFRIHDSFWLAIPFAVEALRTKVSGPRKLTELRKIAKSGRSYLLDFFEVTAPSASHGHARGDMTLSPRHAQHMAPSYDPFI